MTDPESTGARVRALRERKGLSQKHLAALAEISENLVKSVETGRRALTLKTAQRLAPHLGVNDLEQFYGDGVRLAIEPRPTHAGLPEVRKALTAWSIRSEGHVESPEYLRGRLDSAWHTWHTSEHQRTEIARILPGLLETVQRSARLAEGRDRQQQLVMLSHTYHLAQAYLAHHGERELVYLTVDRGMNAALESQDQLAIGSAVFYAAHVLRQVGRAEEAIDNLSDALDLVVRSTPDDEPHHPHSLDGTPIDWLAMQVDLLRCRAVTRARNSDPGAWADWTAAYDIVRRFPVGYVHPWTLSSVPIVAIEGVMVAADLGDAEEVRRRAQSIDPATIPSTDRRARHLVEIARGTNMEGSPEATLLLLRQAMGVSAETVAFTPAARDMTEKLLHQSGATTRTEVEDLARRIGLEP